MSRITIDLIPLDAKLLLRIIEKWVADGDNEVRYFNQVEAMMELDSKLKAALNIDRLAPEEK